MGAPRLYVPWRDRGQGRPTSSAHRSTAEHNTARQYVMGIASEVVYAVIKETATYVYPVAN